MQVSDVLSDFHVHCNWLPCKANTMSSIEVSENVRRRRATVNSSLSLGCHRSTYNRRWNKMRAAFMKKYDFLSFSEFANESTLKEVNREISFNESTSTITPSSSNINQRLSDNSGCTEVNLCSQKIVNRKELMNDFMMYIMSNTSLRIRDADRVLYGLRCLIPDIPKSIRGVLKTCPSVQPKFIGSGVYYHLGLRTSLLRYVELWLCTIDFDSLNLYVNIDVLSMSRSSNQQLWPILGRIIAPFLSTDIGIFRCSVVSHEHTWISVKDINCKCMAINCRNYLVLIPLLHTWL
ncbi:hypothetical protein MS3_00000049 [Schistosoma haematobium]|uniref:Uncharacterized protein n=1 Tax=Schistosoma haematobium TaxID=6185 RepID=A0A922LUS0_SCHHA|nr:hypothetical protein MS3_00000049 [Schistosoma haematobium]KAH9594255.1 hypothetical protein MS3_00000049 [Schistosoma haematobium]